jgi:hypothetical protein
LEANLHLKIKVKIGGNYIQVYDYIKFQALLAIDLKSKVKRVSFFEATK